MAELFFKYRGIIIWLVVIGACCYLCSHTISKYIGAESSRKTRISKYFKAAGHLNYEYSPGIILPLKNGKILALGGKPPLNGHPKKLFQAEDGKSYGSEWGMVELFDPASGKSKILTKMPFSTEGYPTTEQKTTQAIQLADGRIFMVGYFYENRPEVCGALERGEFPRNNQSIYLPIYSRVEPKEPLKSIAPYTEPSMFGLIYDWRNHTFEIVNTSPEIPPRYQVTMNLLPDGRVLIIGGSTALNANLGDSWQKFPETRVLIFDPEAKKLSIVGNIRHPRSGHQTIALSDTQFLLFGGWGVSEAEFKETYCVAYKPDGSCDKYAPYRRTREVEIFDLKSGHSYLIGRTLTCRSDFSAILLPNRKVFIHGGSGLNNFTGHYASELYDLKTNTANYIGEDRTVESIMSSQDHTPYRLYGEGVWYRALLKGGNILITGTNQAFMYDYESLLDKEALKKQHTPDELLTYRTLHHMISTPNGRVFVLGGKTLSFMNGSYVGGEYTNNLIEECTYPLVVSVQEKK